MLTHLYIRNFALIDALDIDFNEGFSVITGETGAGKSIILGALNLLSGCRADSKSVKDGTQRCTVEAAFSLKHKDLSIIFEQQDIDYDAEQCILRREVNSNGKSRAFINDTPVQLAVMKIIGEQLIDIHSQHQNLLLQQDDFQLQTIDIITDNKDTRDHYSTLFNDYRALQREIEERRERIRKNSENEDFLRYQLNEFEVLGLVEGEQEELEERSQTLQHVEEIKSSLYETTNLLLDEDGIVNRMRRAESLLDNASGMHRPCEELAERMQSAYVEVKDIATEVEAMVESLEFDPAELESINDRLNSIYSLERKHNAESIEELLKIRDEISSQLDDIDGGEFVIHELEKKLDTMYEQLAEIASALSASRKTAGKKIETTIADYLQKLGLPNVRFAVELTQTHEFMSTGKDKATFLFSANPGQALRPVAEIASGGEIARVMLSLKAMVSSEVQLPTIIFDEIDTGVSGRVAEQMAMIMRQMASQDRQVISITHLPQIAAAGSAHYLVYKTQTADETQSHMRCLSEDERINEIAQMLSGSTITEAARMNAKELIQKS